MIIVLMGVAGSGKSTVGQLLAEELGWRFADADDFHPAANREKMATGTPLDDADRAPWLAALREHIRDSAARGENLVVACSALKARYRAVLHDGATDMRWAYLHGSPALIRSRLAARQDHFMRPEMLDSQFAALEPPADALALDVAESPPQLVASIRRALRL